MIDKEKLAAIESDFRSLQTSNEFGEWAIEHIPSLLAEMRELQSLLTGAEDAIAYSLRRIQTDVDFFYVMNLTEAQARLCKAYAAISGMPLTEIEEKVNHPTFPKGRDRATIEILRERIRELEP